MSSRYPSNDSRYTSRDRTPPRYTDRRSSTTYGGSSFVPRNDESSSSRPYPDSVSGSASRDVPRGPKALSDSTRGPPPGSGASVPAGPRGRGFGGRSEYRELRDAPPLSDGRGGSSWRGGDRDRHFDRRDRPLSPRARSPGRDSRDSRDSRDFAPRELDIDRARRSARDGPPSAGSNYSDPPSSGFGFHSRGGFSGRGRGRGDWDNRGRGRGSFADERNSFRPRSRSPRPRWEKESSRDDRLSDRRDERRFDRRDDDRPFYRDDRDDRYKRDPVSSRDADIRRASVAHDGRYSSAVSSSSHQSPRHPSISGHGGVDRASTVDLPRELLPGRRPSVAQEPVSAKDKPDYITARAEASRDRYGPRASSPPPQAPQVPAFGSVSSFQKPAATFTTPTSSVWRPPQPAQPATPASAAPPGPKIPPSAPKALSAVPPTAPTGPKATRVAEKPAIDKPAAEVQQPAGSTVEQPKPKSENGPPAPSQGPPAPIVSSAESSDAVAPRSRPPSPPIAPPTGPAALQSRPPVPTPPTGPRGLVSPQQPHSRLVPPPPIPPRDGPPATNIPLGPRASGPFSTSPRGPNAGLSSGPAIPTGPKADRAPPVAPRAALFPQAERAPMNASRPPMMGIPGRNLQWIRPDAPRYPRGPGLVVPAKRDIDGDEKERYAPNRPRSPAFAVGSPVSGPATPTPAAHDTVAMRRKSAGEIRSRDEAPESFSARRNSAFAVSDSNNIKTERPSVTPQPAEPQARESQSDEASEDDDEMDLDDEFFSQSQTRYEREKALLEARLKNLEDQSFRCSNPFKVLMRLSRINEGDLPQSEPAPQSRAVETAEKLQANHEPEKMEEDGQHPIPSTNGQATGPFKEKQDNLSPLEHETKIEPPKLPTPKAEESEDVEMGEADGVEEDDAEVDDRSSDDESLTEADLHSLPYLNRGPPTPLSDPDQESIGLKTNIMAAIKDKLFNSHRAEQEFQDSALHVFRMQYKLWGLDAAQREREAATREEKEKTEEQETAASPGEIAAQIGPAHRQRHVTDYDLENILAESRRMEEERIEKQRREEEASKSPFSNGQAPIPDMLPEEELERRQFVNTNRLREPGKGILTFGFEPPEDDFSPEEHKALVAAYLQSPKDWGEIAKALPGRTFRECINHYYATKWNGEYKPPTGRRKAKRRAGIPKGRKPAIPFANTDQVDGEDGAIATTTERGRPRRAAAPTFGDKEVQEDQATPAPTPGRQRGASTRGETVEPTTEKPAKRQRVAKEKGTKRGRAAQQLAPAPSASPQKMEKDLYQTDGSLDPSKIPRPEEEAAMLARHPSVQPEVPIQFGEGAFQMPQPAPVPERPKGRGASSRAGGMSSYWSVNESTDFRNYLGYYGTDFQAIAKQMGTKTAAMVKNEYVRKTDSGNHPELVEIAQAADERRRRGEDIGPPPPPTVSTKRRYDTTQPAVPRTLAPTPAEIVDVKQSPPAADLPARTASPHVQTVSRFPPLAQASPGMPASTPPTSVIASTSVPAPSSHAPAYGKPSQHEIQGPRRGFFSQREPTRPPMVQQEARQPPPEPPRDVHTEHHHRRQYSHGLPGPQQIQDPRFPRISTEQRDRNVQAAQQADIFGSSATAHHALYRASVPPQLPPQRGSEPPTPSSAEPRPGQMQPAAFSRAPPQLRHLTETPNQLPVAQPPGRVASRPVSPKREESQQPCVPPPPPPVQAMPRVPPAEPRKTSNLADLLNPAPSEPPKPKEQKPPVDDRAGVLPHERPFSAQGRPVHQTTAPPPQPVTMSSSSPAYPHRRELYAESPAPNSPFARQGYLPQQQPQQQQQMQAPPQRRPMEISAREQSQPPPSRDPWARPAYSQPPPPPVSQTSSPHPSTMQQPPTPLSMDGRQQFSSNHRAALSQLNTQPQARNVHSPTPSHTPHHSRTPSYTHPQPSRQQAPTPLHPLPAAPSPARGEPAAPVLAANPYAQMTPPQSIQQLVPQPQVQQQAQRNEQAVIQNRTLSYTQPQNQAYESMVERERAIRLAERDRDEQIMREREAQAQAQAAHHHSRSTSFAQQHYMRQPTPSQADHAASRFSSAGPAAVPQPPSRSAHTPGGQMGYPPPPAPPTHHGLPTTQEHPPAHSFAGQVPSAAQRGLEAIMRRDQESAIRRQQEAAAAVQQHQQAQAQAHAHAQAHREHRYREEVAAAQQREEQIRQDQMRRQHEEIMARDRIDRDRVERDRMMDREYIERDMMNRQREREEWERQQSRNVFGGARGESGGLFGPNSRR